MPTYYMFGKIERVPLDLHSALQLRLSAKSSPYKRNVGTSLRISTAFRVTGALNIEDRMSKGWLNFSALTVREDCDMNSSSPARTQGAGGIACGAARGQHIINKENGPALKFCTTASKKSVAY